MTVERIRDAYANTPFQPFVLHLADGREIPVAHREFINISPAGRTISVFQPDDRHNIIDLLLVTDLEFKPAPNSPPRRRKRA